MAYRPYVARRDTIVYKGVRYGDHVALATLLISKGTLIHRKLDVGDMNKNRASQAKVLLIETVDFVARPERARAWKDPSFIYRVGKVVKPRRPFCKEDLECASGIHFYMTREPAIRFIRGRI